MIDKDQYEDRNWNQAPKQDYKGQISRDKRAIDMVGYLHESGDRKELTGWKHEQGDGKELTEVKQLRGAQT